MYVLAELKREEQVKIELDNFLKASEQLLITAARDLAVLTQYDVKAQLIVSLSLICEGLQRTKRRDKWQTAEINHIRESCRELLLGLGGICHRVRQIEGQSLRREEYDRFELKLNYWWQSLGSIH
ncbi:MAG: hypothetical protein AAFR87_32560 [Bacteroidota bacterium]